MFLARWLYSKSEMILDLHRHKNPDLIHFHSCEINISQVCILSLCFIYYYYYY